MAQSIGRAQTAQAQQYLTQLCKHFSHKLPTEHGEGHGKITFPFGPCDLAVEGDVLVVKLETEEPEGLERAKDVIVRHLDRFAFRNPVVFTWAD